MGLGSIISGIAGALSGGAAGMPTEYKLKITVDGAEIKERKSDPFFNLDFVEIKESVDGKASSCYIRYGYPQFLYGKNGFDFGKFVGKFKMGSKIVISAVKQGKMTGTVLFIGYVYESDINISKDYPESGECIFEVKALDGRLSTMKNKKTEIYKIQRSYSAVIDGILSRYKAVLSKGKVTAGKEKFAKCFYEYQCDESDYEFLIRIASRIGALFFVREGKYYFINPSIPENSKFLTITPNDYVIKAKSKTTNWGIPDSVEIVTVNDKDVKKPIVGKTEKASAIGSGKDAKSISKRTGLKSIMRYADNRFESVKEAKDEAQAIFDLRSLNLLTLNLKMVGSPSFKVGQRVNVAEFGKPIDNKYIITKIIHRFNAFGRKGTYTMELELKSNCVEIIK